MVDNQRFATWTKTGIDLLADHQKEAIKHHEAARKNPPNWWASSWRSERHDRAGIKFDDTRQRPVAINPEVRPIISSIAHMCEQWLWDTDRRSLFKGIGTGERAHGAFEIFEKYGLIDEVSAEGKWTEAGKALLAE